MNAVGKALRTLVLIPAGITVVLAMIVLALPILIVTETRAAFALRAFRRREAGTVILVCSPRHGWHDFLVNNVIPVLPARARVVWATRSRDAKPQRLLGHLRRSGIESMQRPYLVLVTPERLVGRSLHAGLRELKSQPAKSERTRQHCADVIESALNPD